MSIMMADTYKKQKKKTKFPLVLALKKPGHYSWYQSAWFGS
jgi:hypothetical protein